MAGARRPGRPPRTAAAREEQRARLLDAVMRAVRRRGPDVSVDDMAAAAGVSKPVLYAEFGGKAGIAEAVAVELAARTERVMRDDLAGGHAIDPEAALRSGIDALISVVIDDPQVYGFLVRCMRDTDQGLLDNALVRTLHSRVSALTAVLAPNGDQALLSVLTYGTFGLVFATVESWQVSREPPRAQLVDALATVVLEGFHAVGGPRSRGRTRPRAGG